MQVAWLSLGQRQGRVRGVPLVAAAPPSRLQRKGGEREGTLIEALQAACREVGPLEGDVWPPIGVRMGGGGNSCLREGHVRQSGNVNAMGVEGGGWLRIGQARGRGARSLPPLF